MKSITINLSYYNQVDVLRRHILGWKQWPKKLLDEFSFCIIDDCSKIHASEIVKGIGYDDISWSIGSYCSSTLFRLRVRNWYIYAFFDALVLLLFIINRGYLWLILSSNPLIKIVYNRLLIIKTD